MHLNKRSKINLPIGLGFIISHPSIVSFINYAHKSTYKEEDPKRAFMFSIYPRRKFLLLILLLGCLDNLKAQDFIRFTSKDDPKAKGVNFTINHPRTWKSSSIDRPNVVAKLFSENGKGLESLIILIKKLPGTPDTAQLSMLRDLCASREYFRSLQGDNVFKEGNSDIILEGLPASQVIYESTNKTLDREIKSKTIAYTVFYKEFFITLMFSASGKDKDVVEANFNSVKRTFNEMALSFVLLNKYE